MVKFKVLFFVNCWISLKLQHSILQANIILKLFSFCISPLAVKNLRYVEEIAGLFLKNINFDWSILLFYPWEKIEHIFLLLLSIILLLFHQIIKIEFSFFQNQFSTIVCVFQSFSLDQTNEQIFFWCRNQTKISKESLEIYYLHLKHITKSF